MGEGVEASPTCLQEAMVGRMTEKPPTDLKQEDQYGYRGSSGTVLPIHTGFHKSEFMFLFSIG